MYVPSGVRKLLSIVFDDAARLKARAAMMIVNAFLII
jgi:hypothetical protein